MKDIFLQLSKHMRFPLVIALCALTLLYIARPLLHMKYNLIADSQDSRHATPFAKEHLLKLPMMDVADMVNTFIGAGKRAGLSGAYGEGETFPGAAYPFGMVQWSPDSVHPSSTGYNYKDDHIRGFSLTHLSGAGCSDFGDIPFMPYTSAATVAMSNDFVHYSSAFAHTGELAHAGYYLVQLGSGITTELTATQHSGAGRFTYPTGQTAAMLLNLGGSLNASDGAQATIAGNTISGWSSSGNFCGTKKNTYRLYFWAQFSQPFASWGTWHNGSMAMRQNTVAGNDSAVFVTFDASKTRTITMRVGVSFVSVDNAEANVNQENPRNNFDVVHEQTMQTWNTWLNRIQVRGGTQQEMTTFYTALYHTLLFPSVFSDVNGQYMGFDGQVHTVPAGHAQYANYSGWDIYRSEAQLLALLAPDQASDMAQSLVNDYAQGGFLPKWPLANGESYVQVGDPADPILASIYAFGGTHFGAQAALRAMIAQATQPNQVRPGLTYLEKLGYEPEDGHYDCCNAYGAAATTLEYNTADFAISALAAALGDKVDSQKFRQRAQDWRNLLNPTTGYLEPRYLNGSFPQQSDPTSEKGWVEGSSSQYTWMVPFNLRDLFSALGGNAKVVQRLNTFFTQLDAGPDSLYAFLGNEPTLETPWEYDFAGAPYKTQEIVRHVINSLYYAGPQGLPGNDDLGEMSSWYIFSALGMYPEVPGTADLVLASPLFPEILIHRGSGQTIQITAPGASASMYYVQSLKVNGVPSTRPWLDPSFITRDGTLSYTLGSLPNVKWGAAVTDAPPSYR